MQKLSQEKVASVQTSELDVTLSEKLDKMLEMQN